MTTRVMINPDGAQVWKNEQGFMHREDGPALITNQGEYWYINGFLHRNGGPAYISGTTTQWFQHGQLHREDGPTVITVLRTEWWYHGKKLPCSSQEEFEALKRFPAFI